MSQPNDVYQAIYNSLKSARSKKSLEALQQVCQQHFDSGSYDFKVSTIARLGANRGVPSAQTIRNKTGEHYRALLATWKKLGESRRQEKTKHFSPSGKYDWVEKISDPSQRFLVLDMIAQIRRLTSENRQLTSLKTLDIDFRKCSESVRENRLPVFLDHELDALKAAIDDKFLQKQGWIKGGRGCVRDTQGKVIFKNGWINVIEKILSINHT